MSPKLVYRLPIVWLAPAAMGVMTAVGVVGLVLNLIYGGPWWILLLWLLGVAWLSYNFIWRLPYEVVVENECLNWRGYRGTQTVALSDIDRMSTAYSGSVQVLECRDGRRLRIGVMQGYQPFIRSVMDAYPDIPISGGRYSALVEKVQLPRRGR
jgi:hypothetical protein